MLGMKVLFISSFFTEIPKYAPAEQTESLPAQFDEEKSGDVEEMNREVASVSLQLRNLRIRILSTVAFSSSECMMVPHLKN
jgi:hypothetical protein